MIEKKWNHQSFRLTFFGDDDRLALLSTSTSASQPALAGGISDHMGFWRVQARYENRASDSTTLRLTPAYGFDTIDVNLGTNYLLLSAQELSARAELSQKIVKGVTANFGVDLLYEPYIVSAQFPPLPPAGQPPPGPFLSRPAVTTASSQTLNRPGFYSEIESVPWRGGRLVPGIRLDYSSNEAAGGTWLPDSSARQDLTTGFPRIDAEGGAFGIFYQPAPTLRGPIPSSASSASRTTERSYIRRVGVEQRDRTRNVEASLEGFYKQLDQLVVPGTSRTRGRGASSGSRLSSGTRPTSTSSAGSPTRSRAARGRRPPTTSSASSSTTRRTS